MKGLKGLLGVGIGLVGVLVFCGGISWCVPYGVEWIYTLHASNFLPAPIVMSLAWLIMYAVLVIFFTTSFMAGINRARTIGFLALGICHSLGVFFLFFMHDLTLSLLVNLVISGVYIWLFSDLQRVYPRFFAINLVYFLWICYIIAINYCLLIFN